MLSWWLHDKLLLVGTLDLWYVHPSPPLARNHMTIPLASIPHLHSTTTQPFHTTLLIAYLRASPTRSFLSLSGWLETWLDPFCTFFLSWTRSAHLWTHPRENTAPDPPSKEDTPPASPPKCDAGPRRGRACRRRCDDSELGEPVTTLQPVVVQQGSGGRVVYIMHDALCKQVDFQLL